MIRRYLSSRLPQWLIDALQGLIYALLLTLIIILLTEPDQGFRYLYLYRNT